MINGDKACHSLVAPLNTSIASTVLFALTNFFSFFIVEAGAGEIWKKVEKILAEDQGLMVLDGTEKVPPRYDRE